MKYLKRIMAIVVSLAMLIGGVTFSSALIFADESSKDNEVPFPPQFGGTVLYGDVNSDGVIDARDITFLRRYYVGWDVEIDEVAADVNADKVIDARDITILRRYYVGWDIELG